MNGTRGSRASKPAPRFPRSSTVRLGRRARAGVVSLTLCAVSSLPLARGSYAQVVAAIPAPDGGVVHADIYGSGERSVVLVHGGRFDRTSWREQAVVLAEAGFRVVAIDLRAAAEVRAGGEPTCLYDPKCIAQDVLAAVRYLRREGATTVAVIGGSLGGGAAAQAAVEAGASEIERLVLLAHMSIEHPERLVGRKLFVVSRDDARGGGVLRLPEIRDQYERAPQPKELLILEGSAHAQFLFETDQGDRLLREIVRFLSDP
jgi:dienelactone hydrolase